MLKCGDVGAVACSSCGSAPPASAASFPAPGLLLPAPTWPCASIHLALALGKNPVVKSGGIGGLVMNCGLCGC